MPHISVKTPQLHFHFAVKRVLLLTSHICELQMFSSPWCWTQCGVEWSCCWLCYRNCWRCRRERYSATTEAICRHDPYSHFCWSVGSIWTYCCFDFINEIDHSSSSLANIKIYLRQAASDMINSSRPLLCMGDFNFCSWFTYLCQLVQVMWFCLVDHTHLLCLINSYMTCWKCTHAEFLRYSLFGK